MTVIGEDTSARLDVVPAQYRVIVTRYPKLARACEGSIAQSPAPARLIEGGIPTEALVGQVAVARYAVLPGADNGMTGLQSAINRYIAETNADPKPFVWTAKPKPILAAVKRGWQALESIQLAAQRCTGISDSTPVCCASSLST
jgi:hypothetical protein